MKYGVDIASTRLDDLDKRLLEDVRLQLLLGKSVSVLDGGCGQGGLSVALAKAGATVIALDRDDYLASIETKLKTEVALPGSVTFTQGDISTVDLSTIGRFDMVVLQRVLHYVPYETAKNILTNLGKYSDRLYLSLTGTNTEIARYYTQNEVTILDRWGYLDSVGQELFSITAPICLYQEVEILELLGEAGWMLEWTRVSDFGNIKVVARKK